MQKRIKSYHHWPSLLYVEAICKASLHWSQIMSLKLSIAISGYTLVRRTVCNISNLCSSSGIPDLPVTVECSYTWSPKNASLASFLVNVLMLERLFWFTSSADFSLDAEALILNGPLPPLADWDFCTRMWLDGLLSSRLICLEVLALKVLKLTVGLGAFTPRILELAGNLATVSPEGLMLAIDLGAIPPQTWEEGYIESPESNPRTRVRVRCLKTWMCNFCWKDGIYRTWQASKRLTKTAWNSIKNAG